MRFADNCRLVATIRNRVQDSTVRAKESAQEEARDLEALTSFFSTNVVATAVTKVYVPGIAQELNSAAALLQAFADHLTAQEATPPKGVLAQFGTARVFASYTNKLGEAYLVLWNTLQALFVQLLDQNEHNLQELDDFFEDVEAKGEEVSNHRHTVAKAFQQLDVLDGSEPTLTNLWKLITVCSTVQELLFVAHYIQISRLDWQKCWTSVQGKVKRRRAKIQRVKAAIARHDASFWGDLPNELHAAEVLVVQTLADFREQLDNKQWETVELAYERVEGATTDLESLLEIIKVRSYDALSLQQPVQDRRPTAQPAVRSVRPVPKPAAAKSPVQPRRRAAPTSPAKPATSKPAPPPPAKVDAATMDRLEALGHRVNKIVRAFDSRGWGAVDDAKDFVAGCKQLIQNNTGGIAPRQVVCQLDHIEKWCASLEAALAENSVALAEQVDSIAIADGFQ